MRPLAAAWHNFAFRSGYRLGRCRLDLMRYGCERTPPDSCSVRGRCRWRYASRRNRTGKPDRQCLVEARGRRAVPRSEGNPGSIGRFAFLPLGHAAKRTAARSAAEVAYRGARVVSAGCTTGIRGALNDAFRINHALTNTAPCVSVLVESNTPTRLSAADFASSCHNALSPRRRASQVSIGITSAGG